VGRFIATTPSMKSVFGPCGAVRCMRCGENNVRYFRLHTTACRWSRVEAFRTMAERRVRARLRNRVHKPEMIRSAGRRLGARLRPRLRISSWCRTSADSATTERSPPGSCQPDNGDDQMNEKDEDVAHSWQS